LDGRFFSSLSTSSSSSVLLKGGNTLRSNCFTSSRFRMYVQSSPTYEMIKQTIRMYTT
jgi:hypothetical protein